MTVPETCYGCKCGDWREKDGSLFLGCGASDALSIYQKAKPGDNCPYRIIADRDAEIAKHIERINNDAARLVESNQYYASKERRRNKEYEDEIAKLKTKLTNQNERVV